MSTKSCRLATITPIVITLALLGFFFVAGTRSVGAEEIVTETVSEVKEIVIEEENTVIETIPAPIIEEIKVEAEDATATEETATDTGDSDQSPVTEVIPETIVETGLPAGPVSEVTTVVSSLAISDEFGGNSAGVTSSSSGGGLAISDEFGGSSSIPAVSEGSFTTGSTSEGTFSTTSLGENTFTTLSNGGEPGCTVNCGGGGGGGSTGGNRSGGGFVPASTITVVPSPCPLYLKEFIRLGQTNDSFEVRKLQAFLNVFMGESLPITGFYSQADFEAVSRMQARYLSDVLTPWGIDESTGYVFITTRLAINNIYCNRSTANDLDLRNYYPEIGGEITLNQTDEPSGLVLGVEGGDFVATSSLAVATSSNIFQTAMVGLLNFFKLNPGSVLVSLLSLAILFMFFLVWKLSGYDDTKEPESDDFWPPVGGEPEEEVIIEDDMNSELDTSDEDPTQPPLTV
ncbi:hypothetical protein IT398_01710 [Candidatus Nomurabacteria bacterium]|nr:hypothetical protein [Candidatus Nomurabacteria bacterium]